MSLHTRNRRKKLESQGVIFGPKITPKYTRHKKVHHYKESDLWFTKGQMNDMFNQKQAQILDELMEWKQKHQYPNFVPKDWTDCYKLPLHLDNYCSYVWTDDDVTALSNININYDDYEDSRKQWEKVIKVINGELKHKFKEDWSIDHEDPCVVLYGGKFAFMIRGWGHLTGSGHALNLPSEMAANLQDQFGKYILDQLNGKGKYAEED
jgi:hypothetical protein